MDKTFLRHAYLLGGAAGILLFAAFAALNAINAKRWPFVDTFGAFPLAVYTALAGAVFGLVMAKVIEVKKR